MIRMNGILLVRCRVSRTVGRALHRSFSTAPVLNKVPAVDHELRELDAQIMDNSSSNVHHPKLLQDSLFKAFAARCKEVLKLDFDHEASVAEIRSKTWPLEK